MACTVKTFQPKLTNGKREDGVEDRAVTAAVGAPHWQSSRERVSEGKKAIDFLMKNQDL